VEHNIVYFCHRCSVNFPDQEGLSDHQRTVHKPTVASMSGPGDMVRQEIRSASDDELSPFLTENDGVCSKCKKNGHGSATCPDPQIASVPDEFLEAFPKSREAYEAAVAGGHYNEDLVRRWDYCLMAFMRAERKLESTPPTAIVPPANPKKDRPRERQPRWSPKRQAPWDSPNLG
jgi:hypothetical protein